MSKSKLIFQLNWIHPLSYISTEYKKSNTSLAYEDWLLENDFGMTKIFSESFISAGFQVNNYYFSDPMFITNYTSKFKIKLNKHLFNFIIQFTIKQLYDLLRLKSKRTEFISYIKLYQDVLELKPLMLVLREPSGIDHDILNKINKVFSIKAVGIIGCELKYIKNLNFNNYKLIYTISETYLDVLKTLNANSFFFNYGVFNFDSNFTKIYDLVFVGDLKSRVQFRKAELFEFISQTKNFKWWGPVNIDFSTYPNLFKNYQGAIAGLKMLEVYSKSKIILNELPQNLESGNNINFRIWEAISSKSFLLTRYNSSLDDIIANAGLITFETHEDCKNKIEYYLTNNEERENIARCVNNYCIENYAFQKSVLCFLNSSLNYFE